MAQRTCTTDGCDRPHYSKGMCKPCYRRDYYRRNKAVENASNKAYREAHADYWRERWAAYHAANAERLKESKRAAYHADPDTHRERCVRYRREHPGASDAWRKANPELWAMRNRENARRRRGEAPVDYAAVLAEHGMHCHICDTGIASMDDLHFDHVIPLSKGGPHAAENIRPAHALCNLRKGSRLLA